MKYINEISIERYILIRIQMQNTKIVPIVSENWELMQVCTCQRWCCYDCTTVRISCTNTGVYTFPLFPNFQIQYGSEIWELKAMCTYLCW